MGARVGNLSWAAVYSIVLLAVWTVRKLLFTKRKLPLPPGPKGLPIVGNIRDLPPPGVLEWKHWLPHKDLYGPISSVTVFGQTMVFVHDANMTLELFKERSARYSERPKLNFAEDICGYKELLGFQGASTENFRAQRRYMASQFGSRSFIKKHEPSIDLQVRRFLLRTVNDNEDLNYNLEIAAGATFLEAIYGYTPSSIGHDPLIRLVTKFMGEFCHASSPGTWLVDIVPWLRYLPEWMPGAGFKKVARAYNKTLNQVLQIPQGFTERQIEAGSPKQSFVSESLKGDLNEQQKHFLRCAANGLYDGGTHTTAAALSSFFLAMSAFPHVQIKAREEIDRVVGTERLPDFRDRARLPYINAVINEVLRWAPVGPLGLPHAVAEDDEYQGYRIPKGAFIMPAIAWFLKDPKVYHEPEQFKPERFLSAAPEPDPDLHVFGYGRRRCPGMFMAYSHLFLLIAKTLASLDIQKVLDKKTGNIIEPDLVSAPGTIAHPKPFRCRIVPRSEKHAELIRSVEIEYPWDEGDSKLLEGLD